MKKLYLVFLLILMISSCRQQTAFIAEGASKFSFSDEQVHNGLSLTVYTYRPAHYTNNSAVLFVMHGNKRNGATYRDQWIDVAEENNALLLVPEFSRENGFPKDMHYNMGNLFVMDSTDNIISANPENDWAYSMIDPIFDLVKKEMGNHSTGYLMYGHSAGSQFVHRFLYFKPNARVLRAVAANAGWYTMPDFQQLYPYGLKGTSCSSENLKKLYARDVVVLLGEADTSQTSSSLRRTPEAMLQGRFRFERGHSFFNAAEKMAQELGTPFNWHLRTVPGAKHSNKQMKAAAAEFLFQK